MPAYGWFRDFDNWPWQETSAKSVTPFFLPQKSLKFAIPQYLLYYKSLCNAAHCLILAHNILPIQQWALLQTAIESGSPCNPRQLVGLFMSNRWAINLETAKRRNKTSKIVLISQEEAAFTEGYIKLPSVPSQISHWWMREELVIGVCSVFYCCIFHFHLNDIRHVKKGRRGKC